MAPGKPNQVFFILPYLAGGGAERVTLSLLRAFQKSSCWAPILVLTTDRIGALEDELPPEIKVIRLRAQNGRRAVGALLSLIWTRRPDVIFTSLDHVNATMGLLRSFLPRRTKLVLRATSLQSLEPGLLRRLLAFAFRQADAVVFQSEAMRAKMVDALALHQHRSLVVIPNALDRARIEAMAAAAPPEWPFPVVGQNRLVAAGRLDPVKGFDLLITAIARLNWANVQLCILGQGPEEARLQRAIDDYGLGDQVRLCGFQPNPYAIIARAHGFVLSSRVEGFPNVVLEALACRCPVVATPVPGLGGLSGVRLAREISAESLTEAIGAFLQSPHAAEPDLALQPYDVASVQARYEALFDQLTRHEC